MDDLDKALAFENRKKLPKEWRPYKGTWIWIRAIARVRKADCTESWAIFEYDGLQTNVVKDFGSLSPIRQTISIHPTAWLRPDELPTLNTEDDYINYLRLGGYAPDQTRQMLKEGSAWQAVMKTAVKLSADKFKMENKARTRLRKAKQRRLWREANWRRSKKKKQ